MRSTTSNVDLDDETRSIERQLEEISDRLKGNRSRGRVKDPGPVSIRRRMEVAKGGTFSSTYGPTPTHRRSYEIAIQEFAGLREQLDLILSVDLQELEKALEAAGVPWTPGRNVPGD